MSDKETILKVFVSSPSDVKRERLAVVEIIEEINNTWADFLGIRMEAIRWETHCHPGISSDSQQAINEQLPPDYDIYLGVLWARFGTPTPRFESGTEEEFQNAYERYKKNPKDVGVMFYFKNKPVPPMEIDALQLNKVNDFRKKLGAKGILYWEFGTTGEFRQFIRIHLSKELQERIPRSASGKKSVIDLDALKDRSMAQASALLSMVYCHYDALGENERQLGEIESKNYEILEEKLSDYLRASNALCDKLEPTMGDFVRLANSTVEAWINEFIAQILLKTATDDTFKSYQDRLTDLSKNFRTQSVGYAHHLDIPEEISKDISEEVIIVTGIFQDMEQRQQELFEYFSHELAVAANILDEAAHVVSLMELRRTDAKEN